MSEICVFKAAVKSKMWFAVGYKNMFKECSVVTERPTRCASDHRMTLFNTAIHMNTSDDSEMHFSLCGCVMCFVNSLWNSDSPTVNWEQLIATKKAATDNELIMAGAALWIDHWTLLYKPKRHRFKTFENMSRLGIYSLMCSCLQTHTQHDRFTPKYPRGPS